MKGLFIKDFRLLNTQKSGLLLMCVLAVFMTIYIDWDISFLISYLAVFSCTIGLNTLAYDRFDNGYAFLFTLPITRRQYVIEKYLFALCIPLIFWLLGCAIACISLFIKMPSLQQGISEAREQLSVGALCLAVIIFIIALSIPIHLKLQSNVASSIVSICMACILLSSLNTEVLDILLQYLPKFPKQTLLMVLFSVCIIFYFISIAISVHIMDKKEY